MYGIEVLGGQDKKNEGGMLSFAFLFLLSGGYGILQFADSLNNTHFNALVAALASVTICAAMWLVFSRSRRLFAWLSLGVFAGALAACLVWDALWQQATHVAKSLYGIAGLAPMDITLLVVVVACLFSYFVLIFELTLKCHWFVYILTTGLMLSSPFLGITLNYEAITMLALFQVGFWAIYVTEFRIGTKKTAGKVLRELQLLFHAPGFALEKPRDFNISLSSGEGQAPKLFGEKVNLIAVVLFCAATVIGAYLTANYHDSLFGAVYTTEGYIARTLSRMSGEAAEPVTGGRINRGNNYQNGITHLELEADRQPEQTVYLRGFGGGEYIGGNWIRSSDEDLFKLMEQNPDWDMDAQRMASLYYSMFYTLNLMTHLETPKNITMAFRHSVGTYENAYVPYYSSREYISGYVGGIDYFYAFFEQGDMHVDWEAIPPEHSEVVEEYSQLQSHYMEQIQEPYTQVPTELLPRLTALVEENPLKDLNEITAFILYTLHSNASYTLTPGWAPLNQDISEYFLFDNGYGFCEHFALTATLLYRLYGVPARYATGYMVSPTAFELAENGQYRAAVTDRSAHAWVEIFLEDYGWTPVETTPSADGSTVASYPGFGVADFDGLLRKNNWDINIPSLQFNIGESEGNSSNSLALDFDIDFGAFFAKHRDLFLALGSCMAYSVLLLPFFLDYRRLSRLHKLRTSGCLKVFTNIIDLLHYGGILQEYDGTEQDFAMRYAGEIAAVPEQSAKQMLEIVNKAAYSLSGLEDSEEEVVIKIYQRTADYIYQRISWRKKLIFKYIKAFC
ncbi:MAG: transglutaminase-like domain-containing protein [Clostridiales bacterium]|nr:transglutaminase-like domain-containing protein [Clostridiales bacterium]